MRRPVTVGVLLGVRAEDPGLVDDQQASVHPLAEGVQVSMIEPHRRHQEGVELADGVITHRADESADDQVIAVLPRPSGGASEFAAQSAQFGHLLGLDRFEARNRRLEQVASPTESPSCFIHMATPLGVVPTVRAERRRWIWSGLSMGVVSHSTQWTSYITSLAQCPLIATEGSNN